MQVPTLELSPESAKGSVYLLQPTLGAVERITMVILWLIRVTTLWAPPGDRGVGRLRGRVTAQRDRKVHGMINPLGSTGLARRLGRVSDLSCSVDRVVYSLTSNGYRGSGFDPGEVA